MDVLMLRFYAPLMSFGGVMVDQHGPTDRFPGTSLLAGLFANALGWRHGDFDALQSLQARIRFAASWDLEPEPLRDYHTVDLGQTKMRNPGWTTRGIPEHRAGGKAAKLGTHQRYRHYWANGVMTLAVTLEEEGNPNLDTLETALTHPARPLFIGRKTCLPAAPILLGRRHASHVLHALEDEARADRGNVGTQFSALWPGDLEGGLHARVIARYDQRDWANQIHTGRRLYHEGVIRRPCNA